MNGRGRGNPSRGRGATRADAKAAAGARQTSGQPNNTSNHCGNSRGRVAKNTDTRGGKGNKLTPEKLKIQQKKDQEKKNHQKEKKDPLPPKDILHPLGRLYDTTLTLQEKLLGFPKLQKPDDTKAKVDQQRQLPADSDGFTAEDILRTGVDTLNFSSHPLLEPEKLQYLVHEAEKFLDPKGTWDRLTLVKELFASEVLPSLVALYKTQGNIPDPTSLLNRFGTTFSVAFQEATGIEPTFPIVLPTVTRYPPELELDGEELPPLDTFLELHPEAAEDLRAPVFPRVLSALDKIMPSNMIDTFLGEISQILSSRDAVKLQQYLPIEPPFSEAYNSIIQEMRARFPSGTYDSLDNKMKNFLANAQLSNGDPWSGFTNFMAQYLYFIRDVNPSNLLDTYNQLSELIQKCNSTLLASEVGVIMLPTGVAYAKVLARLALGLEKQPELIAHLVEQTTDEGGERMSLAERAANTIRQSFIACLNETNPSGAQMSKPHGRLAGIYKFANICLKIFFECKKAKNAEQILRNIGAKSPPIEIYPRSERVMYLYYLGRFYFSVNHFYRAQAALQEAYDNAPTHPSAQRQRRLILLYLLTSNMILGRLPTEHVFNRPEASGFRERFLPFAHCIIKGDIATFRRLTDPLATHAPWFIHHRIFLQLRSRCEVLVWRSLCRRIWNINGVRTDSATRRAPYLNLEDVVTIARFLEARFLNPISRTDGLPGQRHTNWVLMDQTPPTSAQYVDPDFDGLAEDAEYFDEYEPDPFLLPDMEVVESVLASLVSQGLCNGFVSATKKFAIQGASKKPALEAGWPQVWGVVKARCERNGVAVPGWKKKGQATGGSGNVVYLGSAKAAGM